MMKAFTPKDVKDGVPLRGNADSEEDGGDGVILVSDEVLKSLAPSKCVAPLQSTLGCIP